MPFRLLCWISGWTLGQQGGGAVGVGIGAESGLWASSCGQFDMSKKILLWDEEISQGGVIASNTNTAEAV